MCAGIDWAKDDHAICIVDAEGELLDRFMIAHTAAGLTAADPQLLAAGATRSALSVVTACGRGALSAEWWYW